MSKQREQMFEGWSWSLCEHFNAAIGGIVSVATQAEVQGMLDNEIAKADAMHEAGDLYKNFFRWLLIALAHGIHISILVSVRIVLEIGESGDGCNKEGGRGVF